MQSAADPISVSIEEGMRLTGWGRNFLYALIATGEVLSATAGRRRTLDYKSLRKAAESRMRAGIAPELSHKMAARRKKAAA